MKYNMHFQGMRYTMNTHTMTSFEEPRMSATQRAQQALKLAYLLFEQGESDQALEACDVAIDVAPDHATPVAIKGSMMMNLGDHRSALKILQKACKRWPQAALPQVYFAECCFLLERTRQGSKSLERARAAEDALEHKDLIDALFVFWTSSS